LVGEARATDCCVLSLNNHHGHCDPGI
jgi:hypothetical protein